MRLAIIAINLLLFVILMTTAVFAESYPVFNKFVEAPKQHIKFCKKWPNHCVVIGTKQPAKFTIDTLAKLTHINAWGNRVIKQVEDSKKEDLWQFPVDYKGDCEDIQIFKRAHLLAEGFSSSQLLLTMVWSEKTKWHAVLVVRTTEGEYVLDNITNEIMSVEETIISKGYIYYWRQSVVDPKQWVELTSANFNTSFFKERK